MTSLHTGIATNADEIRECLELRYTANLVDGRQGCFLDHARRVVTDSLDDIATIHWIKDGARIVGTMRSVWGGDGVPAHYERWFQLDRFGDLLPRQIAFTSRLIIAPEYRKTVALQLLLDACYASGRQKGVCIDFMHASPALVGLYERVGYRCFQPGVIDTEVGHHLPMLLTADAHDWLHAIRSPFAAWTSAFVAGTDRDRWFQQHCAPELLGGVTPVLLGREGFVTRLRRLGASDLAEQLHQQPQKLQGAAIFIAHAGDIVSSVTNNLNDGLIQLSGCSEVQVDGVARLRHVGPVEIDRFGSSSPSSRLVACEASAFLYLPAKVTSLPKASIAA